MFIDETHLSIAVKFGSGPIGIVWFETGILPGHGGPAVFPGRSELEKPVTMRGAVIYLRIPDSKNIITLPAPGIELGFKLEIAQDAGNCAQAPAASGQNKIDLFGVLPGLGAAGAISPGYFSVPAHNSFTTASMAARRAKSAAARSSAGSVYVFQASAVM